MTIRIAQRNVIILFLSGLLVGAALLTPPQAFAQITQVQMGVDGMI